MFQSSCMSVPYNPPTNGVPGNFNFWGEREHGERSYERCNRESF